MDENTVNLWKNYIMATNLLMKTLGGTSNLVGEFAEQLVATYLGGTQLTASSKSADIELPDGKLVQVKARIPRQTLTTSLGVIRSWAFDYLVTVLFADDGLVLKATQLDAQSAQEIAMADEHQNGYRITTTHQFLNHPKAIDITDGLNGILGIPAAARKEQPSAIGSHTCVERMTSRKGTNENLLEIELQPADEGEFRKLLLLNKVAHFKILYDDGKTETKTWNAGKFKPTSGVFNNIRSRPEFRQGSWQAKGISKVICSVPSE